MPLDVREKQSVMAEAVNLGNANVPAQIDAGVKNRIAKAYRLDFIYVYERIMLISACLAFAGALMSVLFIRNKVVKDKSHHPYK